jgi:hypothetical protein
MYSQGTRYQGKRGSPARYEWQCATAAWSRGWLSKTADYLAERGVWCEPVSRAGIPDLQKKCRETARIEEARATGSFLFEVFRALSVSISQDGEQGILVSRAGTRRAAPAPGLEISARRISHDIRSLDTDDCLDEGQGDSPLVQGPPGIAYRGPLPTWRVSAQRRTAHEARWSQDVAPRSPRTERR